MSVLDSLPDRPLTDAELASFNRSDALEAAVNVADLEHPDGDEIVGLLLATEDWVKGLAYEIDGWRVVETHPIGDDENDRFEGMRSCESAVREALD
ncbi:hypothetical protein JCM30237_27460 [Halolamina litorea]|uniref:DUF7964 domain-containing protein n=1 Tax=Halolamina litorea TaxID=1515593 RepID=A0ABD6BNC9_9EURY|nr:hypothetical protein [Halolamina litorea]